MEYWKNQAERACLPKISGTEEKNKTWGNMIIKALGSGHWGKIKKKVVGQAVNRYGGELPDKKLLNIYFLSFIVYIMCGSGLSRD